MGAGHLFTSLAAAGFAQDCVPLDISLVIGMNGDGDVQRVLQDLASAGVKHRRLFTVRNHYLINTQQVTAKEDDRRTYESRSLARDPRDEDDLAPVICGKDMCESPHFNHNRKETESEMTAHTSCPHHHLARTRHRKQHNEGRRCPCHPERR